VITGLVSIPSLSRQRDVATSWKEQVAYLSLSDLLLIVPSTITLLLRHWTFLWICKV